MPGKKISRGKRFWERTLTEFEEAGLTVKEFCALKGIGPSTFYQWRAWFNNRLNGQSKDRGGFTPLSIIEVDLVEALASKTVIDYNPPSMDKPGFDDSNMAPVVEASKKSSGEKPCLKGFDLHIWENLLLKVPFGFDAIELKRLVGVLC